MCHFVVLPNDWEGHLCGQLVNPKYCLPEKSFTLATCLLASYKARERKWYIFIGWCPSLTISSCPFESRWIDLNSLTSEQKKKKQFHMPLWCLQVISVMHTARNNPCQGLLLSSICFTVTIIGSSQVQHHNTFISLWLTGATVSWCAGAAYLDMHSYFLTVAMHHVWSIEIKPASEPPLRVSCLSSL